MMTLGQIGIDFFESRGISPETVARFGIYTARKERTDVMPDGRGSIIAFPFVDGGVVVAEKYRAPNKQFWQQAGGRRTFWNADALDDPALAEGTLPLIITEGEIDALTAIDCGFPLTVSVPDGAPSVPHGTSADELEPMDPAKEASGKFEFLYSNRKRLEHIKRFILAVDNDAPGRRLAAELERRLSASRCLFVTYPDGCKDLNDVLVRGGRDAVIRVLDGAQPYPVRGLYRLSEYPECDAIETFSTGWWTLDPHLLFFPGEFVVVTGIPEHGKSTFVLNVLVNLARLHGWNAAIFSPEMPTVPHLRGALRRIIGTDNADEFIERHFLFVGADPVLPDDEEFDLDWLLDRAADAVLRGGIRVFVIDPWNELDHARRREESVTDYIGRAIRALKRFARQHGVVVIVVAHPTKDVGKGGEARHVTLYDVDGSAHWYNKSDHGVIITRDPDAPVSEIFVAKSRFPEAGERGTVRLRFDRSTSRFQLLDAGTQQAAA